ncbi:hypothetical protein DVH24_038841 [Malus domestica]|uniref:RNase H type-1 domain-containing protein n=1 Tax=Malus domestica TaxID=3750 RepID=A0A498KB38_MALDO|nr:hypothetical protein DVH24_038841 [Malus domestica]
MNPSLTGGISLPQVNGKKISRGDAYHQYPICWHPSPHCYVKLNFDGSINSSRSAAAFVLRNEEGQPVGAGALNLDGGTILVAKVVALKERLLFAKLKCVKKLMMEEDSKLVIKACKMFGCPLGILNLS